jgi:hypothetical protein
MRSSGSPTAEAIRCWSWQKRSDDQHVLKEVFGTEPGDPLSQAPKKVSVKLTKFAGKKVRLRFAEVDNQFFFNAAVDAVKLKSKPRK